MKALIIKHLSEQNIKVCKATGYVEECYRNVVLTDLNETDCYEVSLTGRDALLPLEKGQHVLADLRIDPVYYYNDRNHVEYYVNSILPLPNDVNIEY